MFTGDWETGPAPTQVTESPTYTALPTEFTSLTSTYTVNQTAQSMIADYSKYCPISDEDYEDGFQWEDLSGNCQDLLDPYCSPDIYSPSPKSTKFPGSCTPTGSSTPIPSPTLDGTTSKCSKFYYVVANDTCPAIVKEYGIKLTDVRYAFFSPLYTDSWLISPQFYSWNPGVGSDCRTLKIEYYVCVAVSGSNPMNTTRTGSQTATGSRTATGSSTSTTTDSANPSPTQDGVAPNCDNWHYVEDGDGCLDLAKKYNITLNEVSSNPYTF